MHLQAVSISIYHDTAVRSLNASCEFVARSIPTCSHGTMEHGHTARNYACLPACPRGVKRNNEIVATPTNLHITWTNKQESSKIYIVQLLCAHGVIPSFLSYFSYFLFATRPLGHRDGSGWAYMTSVGAVWRSSARVSLAFKFNRSISNVMKKIPSVRCS